MRDVLRILAAPLLWLAAFSAVYALHGLACAGGWAEARPVLLAAWGAAILAQGALLLALHARRTGASAPFARRVSLATGWTGLAATLWSLFPVAVTSACL